MKLLNFNDTVELDIEKTHKLYRQYISSSQVDLLSSFGFGRVLAATAKGSCILTKDGKKILDFTGGMGVLNHGHNHQRILDVRKRFQNMQLMEVHKNFFSPYVGALAYNIAQLLPGDLNKSYFPNSGAEAVEGSMKMAYKYHQSHRKTILHSDISFHGKLFGSGSITGSPEVGFKFPKIPGTVSYSFNNLDSVRALCDYHRRTDMSSDIYAILVEPFSASSMLACSEEFLRGVRKLCDDEDIVLIFDEVYTGWAKTGSLFYFMHYEDLIPDILVMSKSFGGGKASISGYTARDKIFNKAYENLHDVTLHSTTYNGFGEETVTALEAINIIVEDNFVDRGKKIFNHLNPALHELKEKYSNLISEVRGSGALNGVILSPILSNYKKILQSLPSQMLKDEMFLNKLINSSVISHLYNKHNVLISMGQNRELPLWISPPLVANTEELDQFIAALDKTLAIGGTRLVLEFVKEKFFSNN